MGFFDDNKEEKQVEESVVEKVKLGDKEYTQEELSQLVGLGEIAREAETKFNTKIDRVWPEYTRTNQENKRLQAELEEARKPKAPEVPLNDQQAIKEAREALMKLGGITDENFDNYLDKSFRKYYLREQEARDLLSGMKDMEGKYSGSDGRPKFDTDRVLEFMDQNGIRNPESAYKIMNEGEIDKWKEEQLSKAKPKGYMTESASGMTTRQPSNVKVTKDNLDALISEALGQG